MRADAQKNRDHLLDAARQVIAEHGAEASLRDIARRAGVGLATLYRHFPTRGALLAALLGAELEALAARADRALTADAPGRALVDWFLDAVAVLHGVRDLAAAILRALDDPSSPLHAPCDALRTGAGRLLVRAQAAGEARPGLTGTDLLALAAGLGWIADQDSLAHRAAPLAVLVSRTVLVLRK